MPYSGELNPTVPAALALRARGHEVAYLIGPELAPGLEKEGVRCFVGPCGIHGALDPEEPKEPSDYKRRLLNPVPKQLAILERVFSEFRADVVVDAILPLAPRLFAELHEIPQASISSSTTPIPTADEIFPFGWAQPPPRDEFGRYFLRFARAAQAKQDQEEIIAWDQLRASLGLPPSGTHPWQGGSSAHLVLLPSPPSYEYRRSDLPRQFWFVGPLLWQSGALGGLPERVAALAGSRPIVFVCQGTSFNDDPVVLRRSFEALESEPVQVVAAVARPFEASEFDPLPANVILERFVPFSLFMDRVSLMITHAGAGAVHSAFSRGVPIIVMPLAIDQFEVAARCAHTGAAIMLDVDSCTKEHLRSAVRTILADPAYRENARRLEASYRHLGGPELAAALLEQLAETKEPVLRPEGSDPWAANPRSEPAH